MIGIAFIPSTTLPPQAVPLPFKEVEALRVAEDVDPYDVSEAAERTPVPTMHPMPQGDHRS